jgi:hypothetical protein
MESWANIQDFSRQGAKPESAAAFHELCFAALRRCVRNPLPKGRQKAISVAFYPIDSIGTAA